ncbi:DUF2249 domain-containing protein [Kribbella sp. NPDC003557]|uniref:DUF2249 domain-containing protein n=1 Tax=Kribbella sp. NPDC003557 TaxID=3154449 RepID=UPI0033B87EDD
MPAAEIFIQATETDPTFTAGAAVRKDHQRLRSRLEELTTVPIAGGAALASDLVDFCRHELREYLVAADRDLYAPASRRVEARLLVDALRVASVALTRHINDLAVASSGETARIGTMIAGALDLYLRIEESVLPALADQSGVDHPAVVAEAQDALVKEIGVAPAVIDVRQIARGGRHPRVLARYTRLAPGETFILVNNHDPKPLRREFEAMHAGEFSWDYLQSGPDEWRVRIGRVSADV